MSWNSSTSKIVPRTYALCACREANQAANGSSSCRFQLTPWLAVMVKSLSPKITQRDGVPVATKTCHVRFALCGPNFHGASGNLAA
jgi:hypothetical protein